MTRFDLNSAWEEHSAYLQVGRFDLEGAAGFGAVDLLSAPPRAIFLTVDGSGKPAAAEVSYPSGLSGHETIADLAAHAFSKDAYLVPVSKSLRAFGLLPGQAGLALHSAELFLQGYGPVAAESQIAQMEQTRFEQSGLADIRKRLSEQALKALRAVEPFGAAEYAFYAADGQRGILRAQAADVYPLLAGVIARRPTIKMAVDRQKPLNDAIIAAFGTDDSGQPRMGKAHLRRLQGVDWSTQGVAPERVASALGDIPPDWFPTTEADWHAFCVIADTVGRILKDVTGATLDKLCAGCGGRWHDYAVTIAKSYMDTRPPEGATEEERAAWEQNLPAPDTGHGAMRNACLDAEDMIDAFARMIVLPVAAHTSGEDQPYLAEVHFSQARIAASAILFGGKAAPGIFELSRHWHTQQEAILEAVTDQEPIQFRQEVAADGWAPMCNSVQAPNGIWLVPLTDPRELKQEGATGEDTNGVRGLHHCVGGYSGTCRNNGHHILSIRRIDSSGLYERLSTVEFGPIAEGARNLHVRQNRGHRNTTPPAAAREALDWFVKAVADGEVPLNYAGIRSYMQARRERYDDVRSACTYDWRKRERLVGALRPWAPYVGKRYRKMNLEQFSEEAEIVDVRNLIAPASLHL